jgi:NTE family protein
MQALDADAADHFDENGIGHGDQGFPGAMAPGHADSEIVAAKKRAHCRGPNATLPGPAQGRTRSLSLPRQGAPLTRHPPPVPVPASVPTPAGRFSATGPTVALALGGGGARGLAHIPMLEAFDELGVRPVALAGTSMGAIFAAAYASGLSGAEIHEATVATLRDRRRVLTKLFEARAGRLTDLLLSLGNPVLIDPEVFCDLFLPEAVALTFAECSIPLSIVAADYYGRSEALFETGSLRKAVAASIAIPGLIRPVEDGDRVLVDGGAVNPLPFDHLVGKADIIVAIDVTGGPVRPTRSGTLPGALEILLGSTQILQHAIIQAKIARTPPDILIRPRIDLFRALDFFQSSVILRLAQSSKDELKRELAARLESR